MSPPKRKTSFSGKGAICFDLETVPCDEKKLITLMPAFEPDSRLKDPEKIAANIEEKKQKYIERAALDWKTAEVVLIGFSDGKDYSNLCGTEAENLKSFFSILCDAISAGVRFGGHNIKGFDLPMMVNRARVNQIHVPGLLLDWWNGRPQWHELCFDTFEYFTFGDKSKMEGNGVDDIARTLGLPAKLGDGSQFPSLWQSDKQAAKDYCRRDVEIEIGIAKAYGIKFL